MRAGFVVLLIACAIVGSDSASCEQTPQCSTCTNAGICTDCRAGYFLTSTDSCQACPVGKWRNGGAATVCTNCTQGYYGDAVASPDDYCSGGCPPGRYGGSSGLTSVNQCQACDIGTYSLGGQSSCTRCLPGTYGTVKGEQRPKCSGFCAAGSYSGSSGALATTAACTTCPAGYWCPFGSSFPQACPVGTYRSTTGNKDPMCTACPAGKYNDGTAKTACSDCPTPGQYSPWPYRTTSACVGSQPCPAGTYAPAGASSILHCKACPAGKYNSVTTGVSTCTNCNAGRFSHATISNAAGVIGAKTADCHAPCPAGTYAEAGNPLAGYCTPCPSGSYGATVGLTTSACTGTCPAGSYAPSLLAGINVIGQTSSTCLACPVGTYSAAGSGDCPLCPAGRYGDTERQTASTCSGQCAAGRYGDAGAISPLCSGACPAGRWSAVGTAGVQNCQACSAGKFGLGGSADATCTGSCPPGTYSLAGASTCAQCTAGKYGLGGSSSADCSGTCNAGEYSVAGSVQCSPCPVGQSSKAGASSCSACAAGSFTQGGQASDACTGSCPGGYYLRADGVCSLCPAGTFSLAGASSCTACATGTWAAAGSVQCTSCVTSATSGRPACTQCAKETGVCTNCPAASEAIGAAQGCRQCPSGHDSVAGGACKACAVNTFTFGEGVPCRSCLESAGPACLSCSTTNGQCTQCASGNIIAVAFGGCIALNPVDTTTSVPVLSNQAAVDAAARGPLQQPQVLEQTESRQVVMMPVNVPYGQVEPVEMLLTIAGSPVRVVIPTDQLAGRGLQVVGFSVDLPPLFADNSNKPMSASVTYSVASPSTSIGTQAVDETSVMNTQKVHVTARDLSATGLRSHKKTLATGSTVYLVLTQNATNLACGGATAGSTVYQAYALPTYEGRGVYACPVDTTYTVFVLVSLSNPYQFAAAQEPIKEARDNLALGLGIGLGVGIPVVLIALALFYYYCAVCGKQRYDALPVQTVPTVTSAGTTYF